MTLALLTCDVTGRRAGSVGDSLKATPSAPAASKRGLALWLYRSQMRRELAQLDRHQLDDCGLDADIVRHEVCKPFWRA